MPRTVHIPVKLADFPDVRAAIAGAIAAERERLLAMVRATCACQSCKDDIADLLAAPIPEVAREAAEAAAAVVPARKVEGKR